MESREGEKAATAAQAAPPSEQVAACLTPPLPPAMPRHRALAVGGFATDDLRHRFGVQLSLRTVQHAPEVNVSCWGCVVGALVGSPPAFRQR